MILKKHSFVVYLLLGAVLSEGSCQHKELCYTSTARVLVVFDWTKAPGASVTDGMSLWLFPEKDGRPLHYEFCDRKGGVIDVPRGRYRAFCMNNNSEVLLYRNLEHWHTFEVYTRQSSQLEPLGMQRNVPEANPEGDPAVLAPDILWSDTATDVTLRSASHQERLTLYPQDQLCTYTAEVRNVKNLEYVSAVSASLSGLSGSFFPCTGELSATRSLIPFSCAPETASLIKGRLLTFGPSSHSNKTLRLALYMLLTDGSKYYQTFDVTAQVNNAPDKRHVHIVVDGLEVPKPIVNGGGFQPAVDEWDIIHENISM